MSPFDAPYQVIASSSFANVAFQQVRAKTQCSNKQYDVKIAHTLKNKKQHIKIIEHSGAASSTLFHLGFKLLIELQLRDCTFRTGFNVSIPQNIMLSIDRRWRPDQLAELFRWWKTSCSVFRKWKFWLRFWLTKSWFCQSTIFWLKGKCCIQLRWDKSWSIWLQSNCGLCPLVKPLTPADACPDLLDHNGRNKICRQVSLHYLKHLGSLWSPNISIYTQNEETLEWKTDDNTHTHVQLLNIWQIWQLLAVSVLCETHSRFSVSSSFPLNPKQLSQVPTWHMESRPHFTGLHYRDAHTAHDHTRWIVPLSHTRTRTHGLIPPL